MKKMISALTLATALMLNTSLVMHTAEAAKAEVPLKASQLTNLIDLHLHLDGSISVESARELAKIQNIPLSYTDAELKQKLSVGDDCRSLNEYLEKFAFPNELLQTKIGVSRAVYNLMRELEAKKLAYAEIRFAPQKSCDKGMTQEEVVLAAIEGLKQAPMPGRLILCCMRGDNNKAENLETVRLAAKYLDKGVGAVDLAGAEALFPTADFADIFAEAKAKGLPITIHAGEADGPASVNMALDFGASRIGHGIRSLEDKKTVTRLVDNNITLEICPTSNLNTAMFPDIKSYPLKELQKSKIKFTINTDNMSVSNTNLQKEYQQLINAFKLNKKDVGELLLNSVSASFADPATKAMLDSRIRTVYKLEENTKVEPIKRRIIIDTDTAGFGIGNATPVAEFNVFLDAPAYKKMLDLGVPTTIIGLDMDRKETWFSGEALNEMLASNSKITDF